MFIRENKCILCKDNGNIYINDREKALNPTHKLGQGSASWASLGRSIGSKPHASLLSTRVRDELSYKNAVFNNKATNDMDKFS